MLKTSALWILLGTVALAPSDWPMEKVKQSLIKLSVPDGKCSGVAVAKHIILTASHCIGEQMFVNTPTIDAIATLVEADKERWGLALIKVNIDLKPISVGNMPKVGEEIALIGYGMGAPEPWIFPSVHMNTQVDPEGDGPFLMASSNSLSGMSGGPVVNRKGQLVSVVIGGFTQESGLGQVGINAPFEDVKRMVERAKGAK